jgi:hypothetical protein
VLFFDAHGRIAWSTGRLLSERLSFGEYATGLTQLQRQAAYVSRCSLANIDIFERTAFLVRSVTIATDYRVHALLLNSDFDTNNK